MLNWTRSFATINRPYKNKSTVDLLNSLAVMKLSKIKPLVSAFPTFINLNNPAINCMIKNTLFQVFCGGETIKQTIPTMRKFKESNIKTVLALAVEADVDDLERKGDEAVEYTRKMARDLKECIDGASKFPENFMAVKFTALVSPALLKRWSYNLKQLQNQFDFVSTAGRLSQANLPLLKDAFPLLDPSIFGSSAELSFSDIAAAVSIFGSHSHQLILDDPQSITEKDIQTFKLLLSEMNEICEYALQKKVFLIMDAEHDYFTPAIDDIILGYARQFPQGYIYQTYQMYLKTGLERMQRDLERLKREGVTIGVKLVRGAYMDHERMYAKQRGSPSPINDTLKETNDQYNAAVEFLIQNQVPLFVASHNQDSIAKACRLATPTSNVRFGQLMGMQDSITFKLAQDGYNVYKYIPYGPVPIVMQYLYRRAQENREMMTRLDMDKRYILNELRYQHGIVSNDRVCEAMKLVDRKYYCRTNSEAYFDSPQSIGYNATISAPHMHAYALDYLEPSCYEGASVLDIGSGSGYLSACFAHLVGRKGKVVGIDHIVELIEQAVNNVLAENPELLQHQLKFAVADGRIGYSEEGPFDAIHVGAYHPTIPSQVIVFNWKLIEQLKEGGRLFIPTGDPQQIYCVEKKDGQVIQKRDMYVSYIPLTKLFVGIVTEHELAAKFEGNDIFVIRRVDFYCITSSKYEKVAVSSEPEEKDTIIHPCLELIKLLQSGSFYYSNTFDLTRNLQTRLSNPSGLGIVDSVDMNYVWNKSIISELIRIKQQELDSTTAHEVDKSGLLIPIIQGFVGQDKVTLAAKKWDIGIISRLSSNRAGTRFNARGIDDDGHVSNFVESEFLIYSQSHKFSFVQLRGSVPLFWEQTGMQVQHKVKISRGKESTIHSTKKHFDELADLYQHIQIVSLLSESQSSPEYELGKTYKEIVESLEVFPNHVQFFSFDFHAIVKRDQFDRLEELSYSMRSPLREFEFTIYDKSMETFIHQQQGIFRTNCLDCLDRTNVVQTMIARDAMNLWMQQLGMRPIGMEQEIFVNTFNNIWADNGDRLSKIYAGTGALKSSYTRNGKQSLFGFLDDAAKSVGRFYVSNFVDKSRQEAIDLLLKEGLVISTPKNDNVKYYLAERVSEYTSKSKIVLYCGTYNFNGRVQSPSGEPLDSWLISKLTQPADIVVIGCQELIQLTPGEYITADTNKLKLEWEAILLKSLNSLRGCKYVLLRSLHLVALGVFVFIKPDIASRIRSLETCSIKTGLMGMAANKGGIGIRMQVDDTSMAFVTAHFAAGQSMVEDRNRDYHTITSGLKFKGTNLLDHDNVFWFGDFNYRIDGDNSAVRAKIAEKDYNWLLANDQLTKQMSRKFAFYGFTETPPKFDPTYKYDNNSTIYDTSEKNRVPAWTDRVLYKGKGISLVEYSRGEQTMSDHRPVKAVFEVDVLQINKELKQKVESQIRQDPTLSNLSLQLPPPSSNTSKWWEAESLPDVPLVDGPNPFYQFNASQSPPIPSRPDVLNPFAEFEAAPVKAPPPRPEKSSKMVALNLMD
ncbi:inositol polyphosphate 5-phosphatase [Terramyces sp. JEL0728]|nr:inositol polyphosphate 5-phosphatase [Terramyces sp. JEL0728]